MIKIAGTFASHTRRHSYQNLQKSLPKKILTTTLDNKITPAYNTDNMGKLFVTLFAFAPTPKTDL